MSKSDELISVIDLAEVPMQAIRGCYDNLPKISSFEITAYGPANPDEKNVAERRVITDGKRLKHASSNFNQGKWLTRLAAYSASRNNGEIQVVELGTCAGISAMYLLAGMSAKIGGHLTTFEGSGELAQLASDNIDQFIQNNQLGNVSYEVVVGPLDSTLNEWVGALDKKLDLAFIDGNHQEDSTVAYHKMLKAQMSDNGIVVHDDIAWGSGMERAWKIITELESDNNIVEFKLGGKASRGLVFLGEAKTQSVEMINTDGFLERIARKSKAIIKPK